jgi:hypothetical protein
MLKKNQKRNKNKKGLVKLWQKGEEREVGGGKIAGRHHSIVKKIMRQLVKENNKSHSDYSILEEKNEIKINDPDSKHVIDYDPDFIIKRNKDCHSYYFIVVEVIDKQQDSKTMADFVRILAKPEIRKALFICCNSKAKKETDRIVDVLMGACKERFKKKKRDNLYQLTTMEWIKPKNKKDEFKINKKEIFKDLKPLIQ